MLDRSENQYFFIDPNAPDGANFKLFSNQTKGAACVSTSGFFCDLIEKALLDSELLLRVWGLSFSRVSESRRRPLCVPLQVSSSSLCGCFVSGHVVFPAASKSRRSTNTSSFLRLKRPKPQENFIILSGSGGTQRRPTGVLWLLDNVPSIVPMFLQTLRNNARHFCDQMSERTSPRVALSR